jgi:hypothetical protein
VSNGGRVDQPRHHGPSVSYLTEDNDQGMKPTVGVVATVVGAARIDENVKRSLSWLG